MRAPRPSWCDAKAPRLKSVASVASVVCDNGVRGARATRNKTPSSLFSRKTSAPTDLRPAQYDASQAYIRSQAHAGWTLLRATYDDGGFSGGNTDRPALQRLLEDVRGGKVDVISSTRSTV